MWVAVLAFASQHDGTGAFFVPSSRTTISVNHRQSMPRGASSDARSPRMSMVEESVSSSDVSIPYDAAARLAYDEWRAKYGKGAFDPVRYEAFRANYETITVANIAAKKKARDEGVDPPALMSLNEFGDCTEDEYAAAMQAKTSTTSTGSVLDKALEAAVSQSEASSALEDAANALAEEEEVRSCARSSTIPLHVLCHHLLTEYLSLFFLALQKLAKQLGLKSVEELEVALDSLEGIADDGGELEGENLSREARVRSAYLDWCKQYDKKPDEDRFPIFSFNYMAMEDYAKSSGKEVTLNAYADRTEEEYEKLQSRKGGQVGSATVVDEVAAAAAEAAAEAERVKARAEARAKAEAERKVREAAAAKERELAAERAEKRAAEERKRQKELQAKLLALKEWQSKSEAERRALTEKEKAERQKAQELELEKLRQEKESEAIRAAREAAEREAAQVAKRRAQDEEAARIARQQAREWEEKQQRLAASKAPPKTAAPKRASVFAAFSPSKKQAETTKVEAPRFEFELDISKIVPPKPQEEKKQRLDLSALNNLLPNPVPAQLKKSAPKAPVFTFFQTPAPKAATKAKVAPKPAPVAAKPKPSPVSKAAPKEESSLFSFFSSPAPAPKAKAAPVPVPAPVSKPAPKPAPVFSFFSSEMKAAPKVAPAPVSPPPVAKALPKPASPAFSFFAPSAPKAKKAPAPAPAPPVATKKTPAAPAFSFFSPPAPKEKAAPVPAPAPAPKAAPAFSFFSNPAPKVAPKPAPTPAPRPSFSLFPKAEIKEKPKVAPKIPNRGGTISLFGGPPTPKPTAAAQPKIAKSSGTISLFGGGASKPAISKPAATSAVPTNIPILKNWRQNPSGSITGIVSNSKSFKTGTEITTSPVPRGAKKGSVVKTGSGSQYLLQ